MARKLSQVVKELNSTMRFQYTDDWKNAKEPLLRAFTEQQQGKLCAVFMVPCISGSPSRYWASSLGPSYGFKAGIHSQQWQWQLFSRGAGWGDSELKPSGIAIGRNSVKGNYCCIANWEIGKRQGKVGEDVLRWGISRINKWKVRMSAYLYINNKSDEE